MSRTRSPSTAKPYGLARVAAAWGVPRSTYYAQRKRQNHPVEPRKRGPRTPFTDEELTARIRQEIVASHVSRHEYRRIRLPFSLDDDGNGCFILIKSPIKKPYGVLRVQLEIGSPENSCAAVASACENSDLLFVQWIGEFYVLAMPFAIATRTGPPRGGLIVFGRDTDSDFLAHVVERYVAISGQSAEVTDHIYFSARLLIPQSLLERVLGVHFFTQARESRCYGTIRDQVYGFLLQPAFKSGTGKFLRVHLLEHGHMGHLIPLRLQIEREPARESDRYRLGTHPLPCPTK